MLKYPFAFLFIHLIIYFPGNSDIYAQQENIKFERYSIDQGMYETNITSMIQDNNGFLWFSIFSGIEKFDGYSFTAYKNNPDNKTSIDNAFTNTLYEDSERNIWIGNKHGFDKFNRTNGIFTHFKIYPDELETKINSNVISICEDNEGKLWIGTSDGLHRFDKSSGKFNIIPMIIEMTKLLTAILLIQFIKTKQAHFGLALVTDLISLIIDRKVHSLLEQY